MNKKSFQKCVKTILTFFILCLLLITPIKAQTNNSEKSLAALFEVFKKATKLPCGKRDEATQIGKQIIKSYGNDRLNKEVIEYVKKKNTSIEKEDPVCRQNARYNNDYKTKNWSDFFALSKEIIAENADDPISLQVMLDLVSVGNDLSVFGRDNTYNKETVYYAKKAVEIIESDKIPNFSLDSCWPWMSDTAKLARKKEALSWLNNIIGYISYFQMGEKREALAYFYKSTQYDAKNELKPFAYQAAIIYYFENSPTADTNSAIKQFIEQAKGETVRPINSANNLTTESSKRKELVTLYKKIVELYKLGFNLESGENVKGLEDYIQKLINRPLLESVPNKTVKSLNSTQEKSK